MALEKSVAGADNLAASLMRAADVFSGEPAQVFKDDAGEFNRKRTFSELLSAVQSVATALIRMGFNADERAGIYAATCPEWQIADHAVLACGGATVGVYTNDNEDNIEHIILNSGISFLFIDDPERLEHILRFPAEMLPDIKRIICFRRIPDDVKDARLIQFIDLLDIEPDTEEIKSRIAGIAPDTIARLVYTSGTVGMPKGAMLTHANLLSNIDACSGILEFTPEDSCFTYLPVAHIFQAMISNMMLLNGCTALFSNKYSLFEDLKILEPTVFPGVPRIFNKIKGKIEKRPEAAAGENAPLYRLRDMSEQQARAEVVAIGLGNVRITLSGAAKLEPSVAEQFNEKLGIAILEGYGMSETSPVIAVNTPADFRVGSVGRIIPGVEVRILDEEGRQAPPGRRGEIAVRGPGVFQGYLGQAQLNLECFSTDGFFYTGDQGHIDHDGFLFVHGRKGNQVKFANGEYYDLEILGEKFLRHTTLIQQAAIAGEMKEFPVAVISLSEDLDIAVRYADSLGIPFNDPYELVYNDLMIEAVRKEFQEVKDKQKDKQPPAERVQKALYLRPFSPENREATAMGKVRIKKILEKYMGEIEKLYEDEKDFRVLQMPRMAQ